MATIGFLWPTLVCSVLHMSKAVEVQQAGQLAYLTVDKPPKLCQSRDEPHVLQKALEGSLLSFPSSPLCIPLHPLSIALHG